MGIDQANIAPLKALYDKAGKLFAEAVVLLPRFAEAASGGSIPDERDVADGAYLCKMLSEMLDNLRKECDRAQKSASQWACEQHTLAQLAGTAKDDKIRGQLCTATTSISFVPTVPKRGTVEYVQACLDLGLSEEALKSDAFHIHWPGFVALCSSRLAAGEPLPAGIDKFTVKTHNGLELKEEKDFGLAFRRAKEVR